MAHTDGNNSKRCSAGGAGDAVTGGVETGDGDDGGSAFSKACGAYRLNTASRTRLIATSTRIPGHHHPCQARMAKPISHTAPCKLRQGPTNFRFCSCLLIAAHPHWQAYRSAFNANNPKTNRAARDTCERLGVGDNASAARPLRAAQAMRPDAATSRAFSLRSFILLCLVAESSPRKGLTANLTLRVLFGVIGGGKSRVGRLVLLGVPPKRAARSQAKPYGPDRLTALQRARPRPRIAPRPACRRLCSGPGLRQGVDWRKTG